MKITFISVGPVKKPCIKEAVEDYLRRIGKYCAVGSIDVREEASSVKIPREDVMRREGRNILEKVKPSEFTVALSENGREFTSKGFSEFLEGLLSGGKKGVSFITGGTYGLHAEVLEKAGVVMSLSRMTLPHDLARLMISEQVYRAFTIIRGEPYSH